ncbi:MAG: septum formation initiator family protein [Alistipes sp.]|jgi:cell division protein FtsB|nr:septum formation initiator family protein [Alistipes sp.]
MDIRTTIVKYFWITLTLAIAVFTIIVSVRTVRDIIATNKRRDVAQARVTQLQDKITRDSLFIESLKHSPEFLEEFARENFLLQRKNEVVYIIEE